MLGERPRTVSLKMAILFNDVRNSFASPRTEALNR
jgi:hypothetical protein